ncbi:MAG TPA: MFS transporter [Devosia sp.]|nr:MFS transporter [Devosia sp.]
MTDPIPKPAPTMPSSSAPLPLKLTLLSIASLTIMAGTIVAPSLPAIRQIFSDAPQAELLSRMVLTLPAIFVALFAPLAGVLADRYGRKRLLIAAILLYALSGMSGLVAGSLTAVLVGRAALGLAIGAIMTIGAALVGDYFDGEERARYLGLQQASTQFGGVLFVIAGGLLADLDWRAPFAVYGLALLVLPAAMLYLAEPAKTRAAGAGPEPANWNWPLIGMICLLAFLINVLFYTVPAQFSFFLRDLGLDRPSLAGWGIGILNAVAAATALAYGRLRGRLGITGIFALCPALMALGFFGLSGSSDVAPVFLAGAVIGLGLGPVIPNIISAAIQAAPQAGRGRVTGLVTSSMFLGHFISPIASQPVIERAGYSGLYLVVAVLLGGIALCSLAAALTQARKRPQEV